MRKSDPFEWEALLPQSAFYLDCPSSRSATPTEAAGAWLAGAAWCAEPAGRAERQLKAAPCQALAMLGQYSSPKEAKKG